MITLTWIVAATVSAMCFYLGTRHQRLRPALYARARFMRFSGVVAGVVALAIAIVRMGPWAGTFSALAAFMLVAVLLPYYDAWRIMKADGTASAEHVG